MESELFVGLVSWSSALTILVGLYVLGVGILLILDNRSPQSTIAWLFILLLVPGAGALLYIMFGRSWHAFSRESALTHVDQGSRLASRIATRMAEQPARLTALSEGATSEYSRLAWMLWNSGKAPEAVPIGV